MKKSPRYLVVAGALLALSGCQIFPNFDTPKAPVPAQFATPSTDAPAAADMGWREFFQNTELQQAIEQALANNRDLKTAALRIEEARALYGVQRADQLPTVNATTGGVRTRTLFPTTGAYTSYTSY